MSSQKSGRISAELTDAQWRSIEPLFHEVRTGVARRGRPAHQSRAVFEGIHWVLWNESVWADLPPHYPDFRTCHRRFKVWFESGLIERAMERLYGEEGLALCWAISARMRPACKLSGRGPQWRPTRAANWLAAPAPAEVEIEAKAEIE